MGADVLPSPRIAAIITPTLAAAATLPGALRRKRVRVHVIAGGGRGRRANASPGQIDLTSPDAVDSALGLVARDESRLDYLIAITRPAPSGPFLSIKLADWEREIGRNLTATFLACRTASRLMVDQRFGRIVIISSLLGRTGAKSYAAASAAQAGILGLARTLALEVAASGVTVNVVSGPVPGAEPGTSARFGRPRNGDLAAACEFLLSDEAGFVTGQELRLNAGATLW